MLLVIAVVLLLLLFWFRVYKLVEQLSANSSRAFLASGVLYAYPLRYIYRTDAPPHYTVLIKHSYCRPQYGDGLF